MHIGTAGAGVRTGERLVGAREDNGADRLVGIDAAERVVELDEERGAQGIEGLGAVEGNWKSVR